MECKQQVTVHLQAGQTVMIAGLSSSSFILFSPGLQCMGWHHLHSGCVFSLWLETSLKTPLETPRTSQEDSKDAMNMLHIPLS